MLFHSVRLAYPSRYSALVVLVQTPTVPKIWVLVGSVSHLCANCGCSIVVMKLPPPSASRGMHMGPVESRVRHSTFSQ